MTRLLDFAWTYPAWAFAPVLIVTCMVGWVILPINRKKIEWVLIATMFALPLSALAELTANALSALRPRKYDEFVYRIDSCVGQPSFILGRFTYGHKWLNETANLTYQALPLVIVAVFAIYLWKRSESEGLAIVRVFSLNLIAAIPIYLLIPVSGPLFAFSTFPWQAPNIAIPHILAIHAAPNGIPSVHASSALLVAWLLRYWNLGRLFGVLFLILTVFATLGSGQHYLFDLVCAIPYAVLVYQLAWSGQPCGHASKTHDPSSAERTKNVLEKAWQQFPSYC